MANDIAYNYLIVAVQITRHNRLMQEINGNSRKKKSNAIQRHILDQLEVDFEEGEEGEGAILEIIANYDFEGGISQAGMSWGKVGHEVKKASRPGIERRRSTMF